MMQGEVPRPSSCPGEPPALVQGNITGGFFIVQEAQRERYARVSKNWASCGDIYEHWQQMRSLMPRFIFRQKSVKLSLLDVCLKADKCFFFFPFSLSSFQLVVILPQQVEQMYIADVHCCYSFTFIFAGLLPVCFCSV